MCLFFFLAPSKVVTITLKNTEARIVTVTWSSPLKKNGIVYYRIFSRFANLTEKSDLLIMDNIPDSERTSVIEDLQEFVNYTISIQAYTRAGNSSKTSKTIQTDSAGMISFVSYWFYILLLVFVTLFLSTGIKYKVFFIL